MTMKTCAFCGEKYTDTTNKRRDILRDARKLLNNL